MTEWFVSSAVLAALLIGAHYLLRGKISARLQYALWLVLLVRLAAFRRENRPQRGKSPAGG